jgi:hypothetical protein
MAYVPVDRLSQRNSSVDLNHQRESVEAHLLIVFTALAVSRRIETTTGWSIKKFVRTASATALSRSKPGTHVVTAEHFLPDDLRAAPTPSSEARWTLI